MQDETTRRGNYESGADYVLEYGELRFTFNERDFSERVEQAARKLGFVGNPLQDTELEDLVNLTVNLILFEHMGFAGLALGTTIAAIFNATVLLSLLSGRIGGVDAKRVFVTCVKITIASLVMGAAAYYTEQTLHGWLPQATLVARMVRVGGAIAVALAVLAGCGFVLRIDEFGTAARRVLARLKP